MLRVLSILKEMYLGLEVKINSDKIVIEVFKIFIKFVDYFIFLVKSVVY